MSLQHEEDCRLQGVLCEFMARLSEQERKKIMRALLLFETKEIL